MVADRIPARSALTQIGVPSFHQRASLTAALLDSEKATSGISGSIILLSMIPWWSGRSPVTRL